MPNDLADDFVGPPVIGFGSGFLREQGVGSALLKLLSQLKIPCAAKAEFFGCDFGSEVAFAFQQHGKTLDNLIVLRDRQRAGLANKGTALEIELGHVWSSLTRWFARGQTVSRTAKLRQYKYGVLKIKLRSMDNLGKEKAEFSMPLPPYFIGLNVAVTLTL